MNWLQKMERKFGRYAVRNLTFYILIINFTGYFIFLVNPAFYYQYLDLSVSAVLNGQIWRVFTFILEPPIANPFYMLLYGMMFYTVGSSLEQSWGAFRFNLYYFSGIIFHVAAAFLVYGIWHYDMGLNLMYLYLSFLLAFGAEFPDYEIMLFFILRVKMKWLALISALGLAATIFSGLLTVIFTPNLIGSNSSVPSALAAFISIGNFLLYFFNSRRFAGYSPKQMKRRAEYKKKVKMASPSRHGGTRHKCAICGRTEQDSEDLEFRFCSKCEGTYEYCQDHLYTHKHVTGKS